MRRALFVFLLVLLPFQFVWAAAASACTHEPTASASHFGHHAHQHVGASNDADPAPSGAQHADCDVCHLWSSTACAGERTTVRFDAAAEPDRAVPCRYASHIASAPERPDRIATP